jgi:hypothetical protein
LAQKSASTSSWVIAGDRSICLTSGSKPRADQAASSAVTLASSTESSSSSRQENLDPAAGDGADKLSNIEAELHALEEEYQKDLLDHKQVFLHSSTQNCGIAEAFNVWDAVTLV